MSFPTPGYVLRRGAVSVRLEKRTLQVFALLCALILMVCSISTYAGDFHVPLGEVLGSLTGNGTRQNDFVIFRLRLPRILTGLWAGAAFGMSGAIFQSLARNPLASPDIIGFNSGAALGAVIMIVAFGATGSVVTIGSMLGGLCTAALVLALSWNKGIRPYQLVLVGIGVGFTAYAGVDFLMTRTSIFKAAQATQWLIGSLNGKSWYDAYQTALGFSLLAPIALFLQMSLNRLEMGDDLAAALGIAINPLRATMFIVGILLVAVAVAAAGPIAFVALVAGPIARRLTDSSGACLATSSLVGGLILISADLVGRQALSPVQLPAGVFTAIMGAPFLLWLLATQIRKGAM